jgi:hypothetical protein
MHSRYILSVSSAMLLRLTASQESPRSPSSTAAAPTAVRPSTYATNKRAAQRRAPQRPTRAFLTLLAAFNTATVASPPRKPAADLRSPKLVGHRAGSPLAVLWCGTSAQTTSPIRDGGNVRRTV